MSPRVHRQQTTVRLCFVEQVHTTATQVDLGLKIKTHTPDSGLNRVSSGIAQRALKRLLPQLFVIQIFIHFMHNMQPKLVSLLLQARGYLSWVFKPAHMR